MTTYTNLPHFATGSFEFEFEPPIEVGVPFPALANLASTFRPGLYEFVNGNCIREINLSCEGIGGRISDDEYGEIIKANELISKTDQVLRLSMPRFRVQRDLVQPTEGPKWNRGAAEIHVDIPNIEKSFAPVWSMSDGLPTQAVIGLLDVIAVFNDLSGRGKSVICEKVDFIMKFGSPQERWEIYQTGTMAALVLKVYCSENNDSPPEGIEVVGLALGVPFLFKGLTHAHKSAKNTSSEPIRKTNVAVIPVGV